MASKSDELEISEADMDELAKYFEKCVIKASGGKELPAEKKKVATGKAIMKMIEPLMGKSNANFCEGGVVTKLSDKTTKMMNVNVFKKDFFPELSKYATSNIAALKKTAPKDYQNKLIQGVKDEMSKETKSAGNAAVVNRLTDTSGYTGAHKERFAADGKGKGKAGRETEVSNTGYVGNYKGAGTHSSK